MDSADDDVEDRLQPSFHRCFTGHTGAITSLHYKPATLSSYEFISGSTDCSLILWKYRPHLSAYRLTGHTAAVTSVRYHPKPRAARVVSSSLDGTVRIWDTQPSRSSPHSTSSSSSSFSSSSSTSSSSTLSSHCHVTQLGTAVNSVEWDSRGEWIASACANDIVRIHRVHHASDPSLAPSPQLTGSLYGHLGSVTCAVFTPDDRLLASSSIDASIRLHDFHTLAPLTRYSHFSHPVSTVAFHPTGTLLAALALHTLTLIDVRSNHLIQLYNLAPAAPLPAPSTPSASSSLKFSPGGGELYAGGEDGLSVVDLRTGRVRWRVQGHEGAVTAVDVRVGDAAFITGGEDQRVCTWNVGPVPPSKDSAASLPLTHPVPHTAAPNLPRPSRRDVLYTAQRREKMTPPPPPPRPRPPLARSSGCGYTHSHRGAQDGRVWSYAGGGGAPHLLDYPLLHSNKSRVYRSSHLHAAPADDLITRLPAQVRATLQLVGSQLGDMGSRVQGMQERLERCETRLGRVGTGLDEDVDEEKYP